MEDHQQMVRILDELNLALGQCEKEKNTETEIGKLLNSLIRLNEMWLPHIQMEKDEFLMRADPLISPNEQLRLVTSYSEHGQKLAGPPFLTVPFLLYNLPLEDRIQFSQEMPAEVLEHLVPVVWKDQWQSMLPYFLP